MLQKTTAQVHCWLPNFRHFTTSRTATSFPQEGPATSLSRVRKLVRKVGLVIAVVAHQLLYATTVMEYTAACSARKQPSLP